MHRAKLSILAVSFFLFLSTGATAQRATAALPRSTPEMQGVRSEGILNFLEAAGKSSHEFHSFMFLRHGKVIAEGWWNPYRPELKHTLYSLSKSFTATAIGFAVTEKHLSVDDKVISFFPKDAPETVSPYLAELTVKDLLSMSVGQEPDPTLKVNEMGDNWVKGFLATPILYKPGSRFLYNSLATYMLSAIVQKVTGQKVIDYLKPRLFEPLGIQGMDWEVDPQGINTGGWGLRLKTEDLAKFGQLFLQKGNWQGKQVLSKRWVEAASTIKIEQNPNAPQASKDASDWLQGYCYQMWRCRHNAYRGDGAFGQYIIVLPEEDAVIAITSMTPDMQSELNLVWQYLLPAMEKNPLPADEKMAATLKQKLSSLALPLPDKTAASLVEKRISGQAFALQSNEQQAESVSFRFADNLCHVTFKSANTAYEFNFGAGAWKSGETTRHGPYLVSKAKANLTGLPPFKVLGAYRWKDENTLELTLRYIESPHTETFLCRFNQNSVSIDIQNNVNAKEKLTLQGEAKNMAAMSK